ncbi:MAG TPA: PAS domain S-box protein [Thermoanaerobaculia bacterium]|nr:PAS domain S-box protein [Thermoanaerobaculia bacterium]
MGPPDNPLRQSSLEASESRYRRLFETAREAILILDAEELSGKIVDANPFVIDLLGYSLDELVGKELWEIGLFSDQEESKAAIKQLQKEGFIRYDDIRLETKSGNPVDVELVSNTYQVDGRSVIQCNIRDITGRAEAAHLLDSSARIGGERFRFLADAMPLMIFTATPEGDIDYVNNQLTDFTGLSAEEIFKSGRMRFVHPSDMEGHSRRWKHSIATGEPFQHECRFRNAAGGYRWFLTRASSMRDAAGTITIWVGSSADIEERRSVEESLVRQYQESETLSRAKDEFLATSSHELRTPLTSILGWSELLMTGGLDAETQIAAIGSIRDSARAQSRLIDDMLDVSRLLTGKLELTSEMVDVAATLLLAIRAITPAAENKNIRIEKSFAHGAPHVCGDATRLQQIFWNLLSNAVKFTPPEGTIRVRFSSVDSQVEIEVSDTGIGIHPEFLPRVFQSLSQESGSSTRRHGGLGLGLSIVKQLVELHGGTVIGESDGLAQGATFTVTLPARDHVSHVDMPESNSNYATNERSGDPEISVKGLQVLVVDDEAEMRTMIATILRVGGASVVTASSGAEGFDQLSNERFDALVCDIAMPDEDGHALVRRVRASDEAWSSIPAVALTAFGGPLQRELALAAGFNEYVKKPFSPRELLRALVFVAAEKLKADGSGVPAV